MTENEKALLKVVGKVVKEHVEEIKKDFSETIKTLTSQHSEELEALKTQIKEIELTPGKDGKDGKDFEGFSEEELASFKGKDGKDFEGFTDEQLESFKGKDGKDFEGFTDEQLASFKGEPGESVKGEPGRDGTFTKAVEFNDKPTEKFTLVKHDGALWQNLMDDNSSIPHSENKSYQLLIDKPKDGKSVTAKGLYKAEEKYVENDIVMFNNVSWIKNSKDSQELPGEGWFLMTKGIKGNKGDQGDPGKNGKATDVTKALEERVHELEAGRIIDASSNKSK